MSRLSWAREPLTFLVVDDDPDTVDMLSMLLETWGHRAVGATHPDEGIELARQVQPDVVLLDIAMPVVDGFEVCRRIRCGCGPGRVPCIIAVTGWTGPDRRRVAADAGFDHYLLKPVAAEELFTTVQICCTAPAAPGVRPVW